MDILVISETAKMEEGKSKELGQPCIKDQKWLKKIMINKKSIPVSFKDQKWTAVTYRLQNSWKVIFDIPIPWHMVYELIHKTTPDSKLKIVPFTLLYKILATNYILYIHCSKK